MEQNNNFNENDILFVRLQSGLKDVVYGTDLLLVNNVPSNTLDVIYTIDDIKNEKIINRSDIKGITYESKVRISSSDHKTDEHQTKSTLLSLAMFGGHPMAQMLGATGLNSLFETMSNNYDKVDFNTEYKIVIQYDENGEEKRLTVISEKNPELFISLINGVYNE